MHFLSVVDGVEYGVSQKHGKVAFKISKRMESHVSSLTNLIFYMSGLINFGKGWRVHFLSDVEGIEVEVS